MSMTVADAISQYIDREFEREVAFLAELVKVPSDNPPGDCAAHAARARALLEALGLKVEADNVPPAIVAAAGMKSATNLIVRHRFGGGPTIALNAHGDVVPPGRGWTRDPYGAVVEDGPHGKAMYGRGGLEIRLCDLHLCLAGADRRGGEGREARRLGRAASYL
jgi:acetylornithine deacetylase/succinyl-diaminopimelate desuccinylase-like protein